MRRLLAILLLAALQLSAMPALTHAVPPSPSLIRRAQADPKLSARIKSTEKRMREAGADRAGAKSKGRPTVFGKSKSLVILVDFSDKGAQTSATSFDDLLFGTAGKTVRSYYREISFGRIDLVTVNLPSSTGWNTVSKPYSYYAANNGFGSYPANAQGLVEEAVRAVDPKVDFGQYDGNRDGYVDSLFVVHAGTGAELSGGTNDIWSHAWAVPNGMTQDGVAVSGYSMEPEYWYQPGDMTCGVYAHELGHVFGLPDLYDYTYTSAGIGNWSLMATGSWNGWLGDTPSRLDAWSAQKLGVVNPVRVTKNGTYAFPCVDQGPNRSVYRIQQGGGAGGSEYWLVENRQQRGTDAALPGQGLLIWHVDETRSNNNDRTHYLVDLEEAHGTTQHMELGAWSRGDIDDPWPGSQSISRAFGDFTCPSARLYSGAESGISVKDISDCGPNMTAYVGVR